MVNALIVHRARGGCIVESHHDADGHRYVAEDTARTPAQLHALIERAAMFATPPSQCDREGR